MPQERIDLFETPPGWEWNPGRDRRQLAGRHVVSRPTGRYVSEGGLTSRIVGFSPPASVGLVMEPNLLPCRNACRVENTGVSAGLCLLSV